MLIVRVSLTPSLEVMTGVKSPGSYNKGTIHTAIQCPPKKTEPTDREDSVPEEVSLESITLHIVINFKFWLRYI